VRGALTIVCVTALITAGCGTTKPAAARVTSATPAQARQLLVERLRAKQLDFRWVVCIRNGRTFEGAELVRCNVNFGDPHIVPYCSVLEDGRLVTDHDNAVIPCGHDDAGWSAPSAGS
jgi:hypothetical protein